MIGLLERRLDRYLARVAREASPVPDIAGAPLSDAAPPAGAEIGYPPAAARA
jgi:hypothetical protein